MRRATAFLLCCALGAVAASTNDDDDDDSESLKTESHGMMCRLCMKVVASIEKGTGQGEKFANDMLEQCQDFKSAFSNMLCNGFIRKIKRLLRTAEDHVAPDKACSENLHVCRE